jgi:hypothetical protein
MNSKNNKYKSSRSISGSLIGAKSRTGYVSMWKSLSRSRSGGSSSGNKFRVKSSTGFTSWYYSRSGKLR